MLQIIDTSNIRGARKNKNKKYKHVGITTDLRCTKSCKISEG